MTSSGRAIFTGTARANRGRTIRQAGSPWKAGPSLAVELDSMNTMNGANMTAAQRERAILHAIHLSPEASDREIGRQTGTHRGTVGRIRRLHETGELAMPTDVNPLSERVAILEDRVAQIDDVLALAVGRLRDMKNYVNVYMSLEQAERLRKGNGS